jgi:Anti-sigma factor NepR
MRISTAKLGFSDDKNGWSGEKMMGDKGKRLATVMPDASLNDQLAADPKLDRAIQSRIGDQLRAMYDDLTQQPIPDRFKDLLGKLGQSDEEKA